MQGPELGDCFVLEEMDLGEDDGHGPAHDDDHRHQHVDVVQHGLPLLLCLQLLLLPLLLLAGGLLVQVVLVHLSHLVLRLLGGAEGLGDWETGGLGHWDTVGLGDLDTE